MSRSLPDCNSAQNRQKMEQAGLLYGILLFGVLVPHKVRRGAGEEGSAV